MTSSGIDAYTVASREDALDFMADYPGYGEQRWYTSALDHERELYRRYVARDGSDVAWDLIRLAWSSVADLAIAPLQDVLDLGTEARMNMPGVATGNWRWRVPPGQPDDWALGRLTEMTEVYGRVPAAGESK